MGAAVSVVDPRHVFINCPFDTKYKPLFDAIMFAVHELGFQARHALIDNASAVRLTRIAREIACSRYSIHDLSRVEQSGRLRLPRFNMPFEAGIAYCLHELAPAGQEHHVLLLDSQPYRYQASLSDAAGLDPKIHGDSPEMVVANVREFLLRKSGLRGLVGPSYIWHRFRVFQNLLPAAARKQRLTLKELRGWSGVNDLQNMMAAWITANPA